jgi:hypothetical protein
MHSPGRVVKDLTGKIFGQLEVVEVAPRSMWRNRCAEWYCYCYCGLGNFIIVRAGSLTQGLTKSCGCLYIKHGRARHHGSNKISCTYKSWISMKQRCLNSSSPSYKDYGGRGITVCDRWLGERGFENFLADMGERPKGLTLERELVNGNYEPENCRWATPKEQTKNRRIKRLENFSDDELINEIQKRGYVLYD